jgi:hypothetical protein
MDLILKQPIFATFGGFFRTCAIKRAYKWENVRKNEWGDLTDRGERYNFVGDKIKEGERL